jgi:very-short-patch-repair endonuclease
MFADQLRKNQTDAETLLWFALRNRQINKLKFRRQVPLGLYVVDFVCFENRLIVELDGGQHADAEAYDEARTSWLEGEGFHVIRFWNNEVLSNREGVLARLMEKCEELNSAAGDKSPSPPAGRPA